MKCLSVSQPFADLIVSGKKTIELRKWNTNFRGEFLVHAPLKIKTDEVKRFKINKKLTTGAIVGKAELYHVKKYNTKKEIIEDKQFHHAGENFQKSKYGFMIKNAKSFKIPIPWKGQLGFFEANIPKTKIESKNIISDIIEEEYRYQWIGHH